MESSFLLSSSYADTYLHAPPLLEPHLPHIVWSCKLDQWRLLAKEDDQKPSFWSSSLSNLRTRNCFEIKPPDRIDDVTKPSLVKMCHQRKFQRYNISGSWKKSLNCRNYVEWKVNSFSRDHDHSNFRTLMSNISSSLFWCV